MTIKELKKGDIFQLRENGKHYVRDEYDRSEKKYGYYDWDDVNNFHSAKGSKVVITDGTF